MNSGYKPARVEELGSLIDRNHTDAMIAHRFIEKLVGEQARGRDFAVKVPMAEEWIADLTTKLAESHETIETITRVFGAVNTEKIAAEAALRAAREENERLTAQLNTPELHDFSAAVVSEAQHQRHRWGSDHDTGKEPQDWFWLLGYLGGKALKAHASGDTDKALHHTISSAAVLANWHAAISGTATAMRPGIDPAERGIESRNDCPPALSPTPAPQPDCRQTGRWRVGSKVPLNVYQGDRPVCQCHNEADAQQIVEAMNQSPPQPVEEGGERRCPHGNTADQWCLICSPPEGQNAVPPPPV